MKFYQLNGKIYSEAEVIAIYHMWQDTQNQALISESIERAVAMIGDKNISEYVRNNKSRIMVQCLDALPEWGVWQHECLSQNCLLHDYLVADKVREMYKQQKEF